MRFDEGTQKDYKANTIHFKNDHQEVVAGNWIIKAELSTSKPAKIQVYRKDGKVFFTSSGKLLNINLPKGSHYPSDSAKLAEYVDGKWVYKYAVDSYPPVVKEIPDKFRTSRK